MIVKTASLSNLNMNVVTSLLSLLMACAFTFLNFRQLRTFQRHNQVFLLNLIL